MNMHHPTGSLRELVATIAATYSHYGHDMAGRLQMMKKSDAVMVGLLDSVANCTAPPEALPLLS